ncbi:hypothetical protein D9613_006746 [Agrocybe pediades]|uniref:Uncharacterized protein n=1 Tax=Agrocybe pediades TaxID=84607 RepID=A0A8H4VJT2_9AGAR|nr:hypothetical protein D9613_006746 [Agrocybe pediades]
MTNQNVTSVQTLLQKTPPLSIIANSNVVAAVARDVRETFRSPALAAVGLYEAMFSFWTPRIMNINVDTAIPPIANVSTLRLYIPIFSDTVSERGFVSESRNFSVLSGFSSIGGLWTTLSGTFAILFGGSLLHFLSSSKSISIIGIAHTFQRATMKKHCFDQYRDLPNDQKNRGVLALIRDYAIDLSFLNVAEEDDVEKQAILPDDVPVYESL